MFYVYEWFIVETGEIFYVGKGTGKRYKVRKHNSLFNETIKSFNCNSRIIKYFDSEEDAFEYEYIYIEELKAKGQCSCNIYKGGFGGSTKWWTDELREKYSKNNVMKTQVQKNRMLTNNPMSNAIIVEKVNSKKRCPVIIDDIEYPSIKNAAQYFNVSTSTIREWCIKGLSSNGLICRFQNIEHINMHNIKSYRLIPVIVNGKHFPSLRQAALYNNVNYNYLKKILDKKTTSNEFICEYDNQQPSQGNTDNSTLKGSETNG